MNLNRVKISTNTAPTGSNFIVDIKLQGGSIFSTLPVIVAGQEVGGSNAVLSVTYLPVDSEVTVFINQIGSANAGTGLKVWLLGPKTACDLPPYFCNTNVDTSCVTNFTNAWKNCNNLFSFPSLNVSSGTNFEYAWSGCSSLTVFPPNMFNTCLATNFQFAWQNCSLDQVSVDDILESIDTAGQSNGILSLDGGSSAPPGPSGTAAKLSLEGKGWTVSTN